MDCQYFAQCKVLHISGLEFFFGSYRLNFGVQICLSFGETLQNSVVFATGSGSVRSQGMCED